MIKNGNEESIKMETKITLPFAMSVEVNFSIKTKIRKKGEKKKKTKKTKIAIKD